MTPAVAHWRERYRLAYERARQRVVAAHASGELIACGLTNNVDLVVTLTDDVLQALLAAGSPRLYGPRQTSAATPDELLTAIAQHIAAGEGVDIPVANAATQDWLVRRVTGRNQLGGTGAQAAETLTALGFTTLIHLTGCSRAQAAAFARPERTLVPAGDDLVPVDRVASDGDETMWHVVLEYQAGVTARWDDGTIAAPSGNRIIVSYDPVNSAVQLREEFVAAILRRPERVRRLLFSGYSQVVSPEPLARLVEQSIVAARRLRTTIPELEIHLELGAMPHPGQLAGVVERLGPEVTAIGMNADELRDLATAWSLPLDDPVCALPTMARQLGTPRVTLHTATHALTVTVGDAECERDALLFGALVASTRARTGRFPSFADLAETLDCAQPHPDGIAALARLGVASGITHGEDRAIVAVPTIEIATPAAAVGLGDSFTAGLLALR